MPIVSAIVVSRICDMEHKGSTLKMLVATNVGRGQLYAAKYICANSLLLCGILVQTALMVVFGQLKDFPGGPPIGWLLQFIGGTLLTTCGITALQQWISLAIKNQAFALTLGMLGDFIGMTSALFPAAIRYLFIRSYYLDLNPMTNQYTESATNVYLAQPVDLGIMIAAMMMAVLFYLAGSLYVTWQEI